MSRPSVGLSVCLSVPSLPSKDSFDGTRIRSSQMHRSGVLIRGLCIPTVSNAQYNTYIHSLVFQRYCIGMSVHGMAYIVVLPTNEKEF